MSFIRFNGWGLDDIPFLLKHSGSREAWDGNSDLNAYPDDPTFKQIPMPKGVTTEWVREVYEARRVNEKLDKLYPWDNMWENERLIGISSCMIASMIELAKCMTHKSVCVIFGRDMYPATEVLRTIGHKFRGTWIYIEGVSRGVYESPHLLELVASKFKQLFQKADVIYGVDTGYKGTIPRGILAQNPYVDQAIKDKVRIKLICHSSYDKDISYAIFKQYEWLGQEEVFRNHLNQIECYAKPILRPLQVTEDGYPVLKIAAASSVLASAILLCKVREESKAVEKYVGLYLSDVADVAYDLMPSIPQFLERLTDPPAPRKKPVTEDDFKVQIAQDLGGLEPQTCTCGGCTKTYMAKVDAIIKKLDAETSPNLRLTYKPEMPSKALWEAPIDHESWKPEKGDHVKIKPGGRYSHQSSEVGMITGYDFADWLNVTFHGGYQNCYKKYDLILIKKKENSMNTLV